MNPTCKGHPECDLILNHHICGHGGTAGGLQVLGAAFLLRFAGEHRVGVIQARAGVGCSQSVWIPGTILAWPKLCGLH